MKRLKKIIAPVDKVFLIGFSALTLATFELSAHWLAITAAGYGLIAWQIIRR